MIFGNPAVVVQNMFSETPKTFNTVNVVLCSLVDQSFRVAYGVVFPQTLEGIVATEGVGVVHCAFPGLFSDDRHKFLLGYMLHHSRIHLAIALQKAKYNVFAPGATSTRTLASTAKIALIHFHFAIQFAAFQLCHMVDCFAEFRVKETFKRLFLIYNGLTTS